MQTGTSNAIVNAMLSWLKGLASWVLRLFNLAGGFSPLRFLADNWLKLLVLLLIVGLAGDLLIWLIRWRPHWVWFHKKRVIINDKNFFAGENEFDDEDEWSGDAPRDWRDDDFVVTGAEHRRRMRAREEERRERERAERAAEDVFTDDHFNIGAVQRATDRYQAKVFSGKAPSIRGVRIREPHPAEPHPRAAEARGEGKGRDAGAANQHRGDTSRRRSGAGRR